MEKMEKTLEALKKPYFSIGRMEMEKRELAKETMREHMKIFENCKTAEQVISAAKEQGFELTPEQADELLKARSCKLSDRQLDRISGGNIYVN